MLARPADEEHRTASALELLFDLCFVAAVSQASSALEHEIAAGRSLDGLLGFALLFFAIWWAWMNFTWFASAYDTDDVPYRLTTFVQITGALGMAAGAADAVEHGDFTLITWSYVVMRLAMVTQWLRAAWTDRERRRSAWRYASGILVLQVGWLVRLALPHDGGLVSFAVLAACELAVPVWAERAEGTTWHPHHIAERYGLFTLIVLGESVTAAGLAVRSALDTGEALGSVLTIALGGILTVFALWWLYFAQDAPRRLRTQATAMLWGTATTWCSRPPLRWERLWLSTSPTPHTTPASPTSERRPRTRCPSPSSSSVCGCCTGGSRSCRSRPTSSPPSRLSLCSPPRSRRSPCRHRDHRDAAHRRSPRRGPA